MARCLPFANGCYGALCTLSMSESCCAGLIVQSCYAGSSNSNSSSYSGLDGSRIKSGFGCSTSAPSQLQHIRHFAAKKGGKGGKGAPAAVAAAATKAVKAVDPYAPVEFKMKHVPFSSKLDPMSRLTDQQKALLQELHPSGAPLRSLRQLGWPLGQREVLAVMHEQLSQAANTNVRVIPFVLDDMFQSAQSLVYIIKDYVEEGKGMQAVEQFLLTSIANMQPQQVPFEGIKVQLKGRMSGKSGKASKKVWEWGRTSTATISDPVDYAHDAVITRAGYISIKIWIRYKRSHMQDQMQQTTRSAVRLQEVFAMPVPCALPSRSSSAWWNQPGPLQPQQHKAWQCFRTSHDPLAAAASAALDSKQQ